MISPISGQRVLKSFLTYLRNGWKWLWKILHFAVILFASSLRPATEDLTTRSKLPFKLSLSHVKDINCEKLMYICWIPFQWGFGEFLHQPFQNEWKLHRSDSCWKLLINIYFRMTFFNLATLRGVDFNSQISPASMGILGADSAHLKIAKIEKYCSRMLILHKISQLLLNITFISELTFIFLHVYLSGFFFLSNACYKLWSGCSHESSCIKVELQYKCNW